MFQGKVKKLTISVIMGILLLVSPFYTVHAEESDDIPYLDAVYFFRGMYGLMQEEVNSPYTIACTQSGNNWCTIYTVTQGSSITNLAETFNIFSVPSGGSWSTYSAYNSSKRIRVSTDPLYIVFLSSTNFTTSNVTLYTQSGYSTSFTRLTNTTQTVMTPSGYYLVTLKLWATSQHSQGYNFVTVNMPGTTSTKIIPIYYGVESIMSDDVHRLVFGTGQTYSVSDTTTQSKLDTLHTDITNANSLLNTINTNAVNIRTLISMSNEMLSKLANGNTTSESKSVQLTEQASQLDQGVTSFNNLEDTFNSNFTSDFNNIDFNNNLTSNSNLLSSMSWVRTQFDRMTSNNVIGIFIQYSLLFGLGLLVIGLL